MKAFLISHLKIIAAIAPLVILLAIVVSLAACQKKTAAGNPAPLPPNAVDQFDAYAFQSLAEAKAGIEQAKTEIQAGNLPASSIPILDQAIGAYDLAEGLAARYHDSGGTGPDAAQLQAEITADISNVAAYIAGLKAQAAAPTKKTPPAAPASSVTGTKLPNK